MKNAKGVSHTATIRAQFKADEAAVLFFTGMSLEGLTDLKLDMGKRWLMIICEEHLGAMSPKKLEELWKEPELLQWWNLEWRKMDHFIILPVLHKIVPVDVEAVYREMHCGVFLSDHPHYTMMQQSLMRVLKRLMRERILETLPEELTTTTNVQAA